MFFYSEETAGLTPTIILNNFAGNIGNGQTILNLTGAIADDLLIVYSHRLDIHPYNVPYNVVSSSANSSWYNLSDTKYGAVSMYAGGPYLTYFYNCSGQNNGSVSMSSLLRGETSVVMKKLTAQELSGQVKVSCFNGSVSYIVMRNVTSFDMHRSSSNVMLTESLRDSWGSTTVNWKISNTNINASTQKLFICGIRGSGTETITGISDISKNGVNSKLFEINKESLTGSSIPIICTRTATDVYYNSPYASFIGIVIS